MVLPAACLHVAALALAPGAPLLRAPATSALPLNVYIEDTDAYSVVFYANYLKYWERAAVSTLGAQSVGSLLRKDSLCFGLHSAHGMRYSLAARLGDACEARLTPMGVAADGRLAARAALVRASDGKEFCSAADVRFGFTNRDGACVPWPLDAGDWPVADEAPGEPCAEDDASSNPPAAQSSPTLEPDGSLLLELDEASAAGSLTLHAAARYFERHRTTFLGGPSGLQLLADAGVSVVVARINNFGLSGAAHRVGVGEPLELRCRAVLRARKTQILFEQWLVHGVTGEPLARADVSCLCVDAAAGKMCAAPPAAVERIERWLT